MRGVGEASAELGTRLGISALMNARSLSMNNTELYNVPSAVAGSEAEGAWQCTNVKQIDLTETQIFLDFHKLHTLSSTSSTLLPPCGGRVAVSAARKKEGRKVCVCVCVWVCMSHTGVIGTPVHDCHMQTVLCSIWQQQFIKSQRKS